MDPGQITPLLKPQKARLSCTVCRQKHIKCDQRRPMCGPCDLRFPVPDCRYEPASTSRPSSSGFPTPPQPRGNPPNRTPPPNGPMPPVPHDNWTGNHSFPGYVTPLTVGGIEPPIIITSIDNETKSWLLGEFLRMFRARTNALNSNRNPGTLNQFQAEFIPRCESSPFLAEISRYMAAKWLAGNSGSGADGAGAGAGLLSPDLVMNTQASAIGMLTSMPSTASSDEAIAGVVHLINHEVCHGEAARVAILLGNLQSMVIMREGVDNLGMNGLLAKLAVLTDLVAALTFETAPILLSPGGGGTSDNNNNNPPPPRDGCRVQHSTPLLWPLVDFDTLARPLGLARETAAFLDDTRMLLNKAALLTANDTTGDGDGNGGDDPAALQRLGMTARFIHAKAAAALRAGRHHSITALHAAVLRAVLLTTDAICTRRPFSVVAAAAAARPAAAEPPSSSPSGSSERPTEAAGRGSSSRRPSHTSSSSPSSSSSSSVDAGPSTVPTPSAADDSDPSSPSLWSLIAAVPIETWREMPGVLLWLGSVAAPTRPGIHQSGVGASTRPDLDDHIPPTARSASPTPVGLGVRGGVRGGGGRPRTSSGGVSNSSSNSSRSARVGGGGEIPTTGDRCDLACARALLPIAALQMALEDWVVAEEALRHAVALAAWLRGGGDRVASAGGGVDGGAGAGFAPPPPQLEVVHDGGSSRRTSDGGLGGGGGSRRGSTKGAGSRRSGSRSISSSGSGGGVGGGSSQGDVIIATPPPPPPAPTTTTRNYDYGGPCTDDPDLFAQLAALKARQEQAARASLSAQAEGVVPAAAAVPAPLPSSSSSSVSGRTAYQDYLQAQQQQHRHSSRATSAPAAGVYAAADPAPRNQHLHAAQYPNAPGPQHLRQHQYEQAYETAYDDPHRIVVQRGGSSRGRGWYGRQGHVQGVGRGFGGGAWGAGEGVEMMRSGAGFGHLGQEPGNSAAGGGGGAIPESSARGRGGTPRRKRDRIEEDAV